MSRHNIRRSTQTRAGLTVVEVVVIVIVALVVASLVFPPVRTAREAARRMQCANNLKQLGLAVHNYESAHGRLPAAVGGTGVGPTPLDGNANRLSGWVALLPYIEQADFFQ